MTKTTRDTRRDGFTLIELLVVISIIALLVGILLPALGAARRSAQSAVCLGHQRSIGQGIAVYASSNNDWLPGPYTSGYYQGLQGNSYTFKNSPTEPVQNMDWISPALGDSLGLPSDKLKRLYAIANDELKCPSNDQAYDTVQVTGSTGESLSYTSYSAVLGFHHVNSADSGAYMTSPVENTVKSAIGYRPRLDQVGPPSAKALAIDGARYIFDGPTGKESSYNDFPKQIRGGNYMEYGPLIAYENGPWGYSPANSSTPTDWSLRFGFRHSGGINVVYFDGHGSSMKAAEAHPAEGLTLESVTPWFPSGSIIANSPTLKVP